MEIVTLSTGERMTARTIPADASFGKWKVLRAVDDLVSLNGKRRPRYLCRCQCGREKEVLGQNLLNGNSLNCGCLRANKLKYQTVSHDESFSRLYKIWAGMKSRCQCPQHPDYHHYGGRGIRVYTQWEHYESFSVWAHDNGYADNLTLDRIDTNGNYEPSNCRWVTRSRQMRNTRISVQLTAFGETKSLHDWVEDSRCVVPVATLWCHVRNYKWETEKAITTPSLRSRTWHFRRTPNWRG